MARRDAKCRRIVTSLPKPARRATSGIGRSVRSRRYDVVVAYDATHPFDLDGPFGWRRSADVVAQASAVSLHGGGFARVVATKEVVDAAG